MRFIVTIFEFRQLVSDTGNHVIDHGYFVYNDDGTKSKVAVSISFWDLFEGLKELSPRKREAVWYNVILDQKQRDVAKKMSITTVSVGQYVEQAMIQLSERYFAEDSSEVTVLQDGGNDEGASNIPEDAK